MWIKDYISQSNLVGRPAVQLDLHPGNVSISDHANLVFIHNFDICGSENIGRFLM